MFYRLYDKGSQLIFRNSGLKKLKTLILDKNLICIPISENELSKLTELHILNNNLNSEGSQSIFKANNFSRLKKVCLENNQIEIASGGKEGSLCNVYKVSIFVSF